MAPLLEAYVMMLGNSRLLRNARKRIEAEHLSFVPDRIGGDNRRIAGPGAEIQHPLPRADPCIADEPVIEEGEISTEQRIPLLPCRRDPAPILPLLLNDLFRTHLRHQNSFL